MLKRINNTIFMSDGEYQCTWTHHKELDVGATQAKITECENSWQEEIDACQEQIDNYNELKDTINSKMEEAANLGKKFDEGQGVISNAHINTNLNSCLNCIDELQQEFQSMLSECGDKIDEWTQKRDDAKDKKDACKSDTANEVYREWDSCD